MNKEFLERFEKITRKFETKKKWGVENQLLHVYEEVAETQRAYRNMDMDNFKEEICDIILSAITLFHKLDVSPEEIQNVMEKTLQKVEYRCGLRQY